MSGVLDRLKKKRGYPVVVDGQTFHVRSLTIGEFKRYANVKDDAKTGFVIGCALCCDENGDQEFPKLTPAESDVEWAARVLDELEDVPSENIRAISDGVAALSKTPSASAVAKN
jgi:hypothetical protein